MKSNERNVQNYETDMMGISSSEPHSVTEGSENRQSAEKEYHFYGWQNVNPSILALYDDVRQAWCAETCAPRMRAD